MKPKRKKSKRTKKPRKARKIWNWKDGTLIGEGKAET